MNSQGLRTITQLIIKRMLKNQETSALKKWRKSSLGEEQVVTANFKHVTFYSVEKEPDEFCGPLKDTSRMKGKKATKR